MTVVSTARLVRRAVGAGAAVDETAILLTLSLHRYWHAC